MRSFLPIITFSVTQALLLTGCNTEKQETLFELLPSTKTGITFNNLLTETDSFNVLTFEYIYNGGGVGTGDVNNDGLTDIFFAGNMVPNKLYLNKGNFEFEDVTDLALPKTDLWCTGVAMADLNQDGILDIYVSTIQPFMEKTPVPNLLFLSKGIRDGIPFYGEAAAETGLADSSYSTQAAFLDYDLDGDLDMYLLTNALENYNRNQAVGQKNDGSGKSVDKLFRNEGIVNGIPVFQNVSDEAGIRAEGWGLGIVVNDLNNDGYPDVYVANDFASNDHLYVNTGSGAFTNDIASMLKHQEHNGMGADIADINNDGLNDIVALDMLPDDNLRQKTMFANIGYDRFMLFRNKGYQDQYMRNVLQLNNGNNTFSDIGYLAGIYATDWSWSSLLADFDNDGYRDLFVGNGYRKDITDQDFIAYSKGVAMFATDRNRMNTIRQEVEKLPGVKKPNFLFRNNGDLTFSDMAANWGMDQPSYSNGAAYADLDNDGDLDLVTNNINDEAFVYRNNLIDQESKTENHFLRIRLEGKKGNTHGFGTKIRLYIGDNIYYAEHQAQRGYKSSVEGVEHFGLGNISSGTVDSIRITWPLGETQVLTNVAIDQTITLTQANANAAHKTRPASRKMFRDLRDATRIHYKHRETDYVDFLEGQFLLPRKHSQEGPGIAVGDVNGDGLDDFVIGGAASQSARIFKQRKDGTFQIDSLPAKQSEDMGLLLFDADNDNDADLYCVSGSSEFGQDDERYQDRFYRNDGRGSFILDQTAIPEIKSSGSCVVAADFDRDNDLDLFVGGRVVPKRYPETPPSYLLVNDGHGKFEILRSPEIARAGMVNSAIWTDVNNDGWIDLAVVGEWMPITFFINEQGSSFKTLQLANTSGWWNSIAGGDFDNDGDTDYVAGNVGLNSLFKASETEPVSIIAKDFDGNGSLDPIMCRYIQGKEYPVHPRDALTGQITSLKRVVRRYSEYGMMNVEQLFPPEKLQDALVLKSTLFKSVYIENSGNNSFSIRALPMQAQFAPIYGIAVADEDQDGNLDILSVGNSYACEPLSGHYDAGIGNFLKGDGKGNFEAVPVTSSGFFIDGDAKALARVTMANGHDLYLITQNRDSLKVLARDAMRATEASVVKAKPLDTHVLIELVDGRKRKQEFYYGSGYLSSSSRSVVKDEKMVAVVVSGEW